MSKDYFEQMSGFSKNAMAPMLSWSKMSSKLMERLARQHAGAASEMYASFVKHQQSLFGCKKIEDAMSLQADYATSATNKSLDYGQQLLDTMVEASSELNKWFEEGAKSMSEADKSKK